MSNKKIDELYCDIGIVVETEGERQRRLRMAARVMTQVIPDKKKYKRKQKHTKDYRNESY